MKALWISPLFAALASAKPSCRCLYGEQCWPTQADFSGLAARLSQPILHPIPPASACYPASNPSGNCTEVVSNANSGRWRSDQPGSMQASNFETYIFSNGTISACYLNATLGFPCSQGSVPVVGVDARSVSDVQAAVKFAAQHKLRFVVKNTGHDYLGRSTARGAFLLWMHHFKNITYHDTFLPDGAPSSESHDKAITLGAGIQWYEAYAAAEAHNRFVLGGLSGSVGAVGGWVQGGGHGAFAARHGLGVDNVIQFTVVTSNGEFLTANSHQNSDLFWALRGGGGGTYAVVISATYATHDPFPLSLVIFTANFSSPQIARSVITEYVKLHPSLADAGWGGYSFLSAKNLTFAYVVGDTSVASANATLDPFVKFSQNATDGQAEASFVPYDSFNTWYTTSVMSDGQVGINGDLASRLIPRKLAEENPAKVADVMLDIGDVGINFVAGGAVSKADPDSTGLHPDWRKAIAHVFYTEGWSDGDPVSEIQEVHQRTRSNLDKLDELGSATYLNEASLYEKDFRQTFFGPHYNKLKRIKAKYDPVDLFVVPSGVGSEDWDAELNCRR